MRYIQRHSMLRIAAQEALLIALCVLLFIPAIAEAVPATQQLKAARAEASAARKKLDDIAIKLELATEDYEEAANAVKATESDIFATSIELKKAQNRLDAIQLKLNSRAEAVYRGDQLSIVDVVLGADNFSDLVTRLDMIQRLSEQDNSLLYDMRITKSKIVTAQEQLKEKKARQIEAERTFAQKKAKAESLFAEQNTYMQSLNSKVKELIATERKQIAEEQRKAAEAQRRAQQQSQNGSNSGSVSGGREFTGGSLGGSHGQVVSIAQQFVGKTPYVWGGTSPSGFDCSGLTQYCYRKIGINIPRTSREQYRIGSFIPANRTDLLQPGDLLFFGYNRNASQIHHVALYAGGGRMIHAPQTGMNVSVTYLGSRSDYVGAVRP